MLKRWPWLVLFVGIIGAGYVAKAHTAGIIENKVTQAASW